MVFSSAIIISLLISIAVAGAANEEPGRNHNIYVLLLGTSGCGKSSTINFLLNKTIARVGDSDSTTSAIHEYSVQISTHAGGAGNLTFIDTPGYGDTRGLEYDARFIASLQEYFETHEELSKRKPDVVLLCHRYDDNRFSGQASQFVKMLKGISFVQDHWFGHHERDNVSNTAILLTHSRTEEDSELRIPAYRKTLEDYTQFPSSMTILLCDNKLQDEGDSDDQDSEELLPVRPPASGLWYPENVCSWMKRTLTPTLSAKIDIVCNLSYHSVEETKSFALLGPTDSKSRNMLQILTKMELLVEETPVSLALARVFNNLQRQRLRENATFQPDTLSYLQKSLNLLRIINIDDLLVTNGEVARLFRSLGTSSDDILILLKAAFNIQPVKLFGHTKLPIGFNYNPRHRHRQKSVMSESLFDLRRFHASPIGYRIPTPIICTPLPSSDANAKLHIQTYNWQYHTILIEIRTMHCKLPDGALENQFNTNNLAALGNLGRFGFGWQHKDYASVFSWKTFMQKFGSRVVAGGYLGGLVRIARVPKSWNVTSISVNELIRKLTNEAPEPATTEYWEYYDDRITISGGSESFYSANPKVFFGRPFYASWLKSIENFPVPLPDTFELKPIADYLRLVNATIANEFASAVAYFESVMGPPEGLIVPELQKTKDALATAGLQARTLRSDLFSCTKEKNATLKQNYEIAHKLITSESSLKEAQIKLVATEAERVRLNSENENYKMLLANARAATVNEQSHSRELNRLLGGCNTQAASAQASLATCNLEKQTCEAQRLRVRHQGSGERDVYHHRTSNW